MFKSSCISATISSITYGTSYSNFVITTNEKLSTEALKNNIFSEGMAGSIVRKKSEKEVLVDISAMANPPTSFKFKYRGLTNFCEVGFSEATTHSITMPTAVFETVTITSAPVANKCANLVLTSIVTKPYSWDVEYSWTVQYTSTTTPTALTQIVSATKTGTLTVETGYLIEAATFQASLSITTPFSQTITSNVLTYTVQTTSTVDFACSPCKFTDRTKCIGLNSICWDDYTVYSLTYPLLFSENCLESVAPICYTIWNTNGLSDPQCLDFVPYIDFSKMWIKPNVISSAYFVDGILKLRIQFDIEVKTPVLSTCNAIFEEETLLLLGSSVKCLWYSAKVLDVVYSGTNNLVTSVKVRKNSIYYNYRYAINPSDSVSLTPTLPDLTGTLSINVAYVSSSCKTLPVTAVTSINGIFEYSYTWTLSYPQISVPSSIQSNFNLLASQNSKMISVSSADLLSDNYLKILLTVHVSTLNTDITSERTIYITSTVPAVRFASSELYELGLIGSKTNDLGLVIDSDPCNSGTLSDTSISFLVYSGTILTQINTRGSNEIKLEETLLATFKKYNLLSTNVKLGFKYNRYYNLTVCAKFTNYEKLSCRSKIIGIYKSPILVSIKDLPSFAEIPKPLSFNGVGSTIPLEIGEKVKFKWQCISCYSFVSNSDCECPSLLESEAASRVFSKTASKFSDFCKYKFRLSVTSQDGVFQRTNSSEVMFITTSSPVSMLEGKINYMGQNDIYFSFTLNYQGKDSDVSFKWALIEVSNTSPSNTFSHSKLNTFVYDFFSNKGVSLNSQCKNGDSEIPDTLKPSEITKNTNRVMGIKKAGMVSESTYEYAVLVQEPSVLSAIIISIKVPKKPASRSLSITPTSGLALETKFVLTYPVSSGENDPNEIINILAVNCYGSEKLVHYTVGSSTTFEGVLSSGKSSCGYQVTLVLRVILEKEAVDQNVTVIVQPSSSSIPSTISKHLSKAQATNSYTNTLTILSSVTSNFISEESDQTKENIKNSYDILSQMDNKVAGVYTQLDESSKLQFLNFSLNILENLLTHNTITNLNLTLQNLIEQKIDDYVCRLDTKSTNIIATAINTLSASAYLKTQRGGEQSYATIGATLEKLRKIKLPDLQPGGLAYEVTSPMIAIKMLKQYGKEFNEAQVVSNKVVTNVKETYASSNNIKTAETKVRLPGSLTQRVVDCMPNVGSYNTTFMVSTSLISLKVNPYENVKLNSYIDVNSITPLSYNTGYIEASVIKSIYRDLRRHKFDNVIDIYAQDTDMIQLTFNGSTLEKDASTTEYQQEVTIGKLNNSDTVEYVQPFESTEESRKNTMLIPVYREDTYWTNIECELTEVTDTEITTTSESIGSSKSYSFKHAVEIVTDSFTDILKVLKAGNYEMLVSFDKFDELTVKNFVILTFCAVIFFGMFITEYILFLKDKKELVKQKLKTLEYLVESKELPPPEGIIASIFHFFNLIKKKGLKAFSKENNNAVVPENNPNEDQLPAEAILHDNSFAPEPEVITSSKRFQDNVEKKIEEFKESPDNIDTTNGYTKFNEEEQKNLDNLFDLYKQKRNMYSEKELIEIFQKEVENCAPLNRRTRDYIQDTMMGYSGVFLILLQQELISALILVDLKITRPFKLLIFELVLFSDLAVNGLFFNSEDSVDVSEQH